MLELHFNKPKQLVAVVLASYGDAHGFLHEAHKIGHDAYPENDPKAALKTLKTQRELYGTEDRGVNAVVVDVSRVSGLGFYRRVRMIDRGVPIIGYSSVEGMNAQLEGLAAFKAVDAIVREGEINPEAVLSVYRSAINVRRSRMVASQGVA